MHKTAVIALATAGLAAAAAAEPTFFVFQAETLHRFTLGGSIDTFVQDDRVMGMDVDPNGVLRGTSAQRRNSQSGWEAYSINDPFGSPSLNLLQFDNDGPYAFVEYVGNTCYSTNSDGELLILDSTSLLKQSVVGNMGIGGNNVGAGYDRATDTFYMINKDTNSLYTVDYTNATADLVGDMGFDWFNAGADFWGGKLYATVQDLSRGELILGTINTSTAEFTPLRTVATFDPGGDPVQVSLAITPAPTALALLGIAALGASRRRR